jgi:hypothetical protein
MGGGGSGRAVTAAERMRAYRARREAGVIVVPVEVPEVDAAEALIEANLLPRAAAEDRTALAAALGELIRRLVARDS